MISVNVLGEFYPQLPMGRNNTRFGVEIKHLLVRSGELHYIDMFVGRQID